MNDKWMKSKCILYFPSFPFGVAQTNFTCNSQLQRPNKTMLWKIISLKSDPNRSRLTPITVLDKSLKWLWKLSALFPNC